MQTFTKLFTTRIVASSRSTSVNSRNTVEAEGVLRSRSVRTSLCESEKNDVSAPETSAERHSNTNVTAQSAAMVGVKWPIVIQGSVFSKSSADYLIE